MKLKRNSLKLFRFSFTSLCGQFKILDETDLWLTGNLTEASSNCLYIVTVSELQSVMSFVAAEVLKLPSLVFVEARSVVADNVLTRQKSA